jgi:hypothetical protein
MGIDSLLERIRERPADAANPSLADFARQYQGYAAHFPRVLTALISRLESPAHPASLRQIAIDCADSERGRAELALGMHKALALRDSFWSWLHERAQRRRP